MIVGHTSARNRRARARVDVLMLILHGEWLKASGFPIGAKAFLSTDKQGDITLTRLVLTWPRKLRIAKARPERSWRSINYS